MNYFFYQTKTKFSNTGDVLINKSLIELLRNYGNIIANDKIPKDFLNNLGIKENEKLNKFSKTGSFMFTILTMGIKNIFSKNKIFIFSGLGHNYGGSFKKNFRNILSGFLFPIFRLLKIQIIRIGISIGPITNFLGYTELFRSIFINHYLVRDSESLKLCHSIGIKKARLCPDLSWSYESPKISPIKKTTITINLRNSTLDEYIYIDYINKLMKNLSSILDYLTTFFGNNIFIQIVYQVKEDKDFAQFIFNKFKTKFNISFVEEQLSLNSAAKYYQDSLITISNRMHSLLLCYKYGSLPIALIDKKEHIKITSTFKDINLDELILDINKNISVKNIENIVNKKDILLCYLREIENKNKVLTKRIISEII